MAINIQVYKFRASLMIQCISTFSDFILRAEDFKMKPRALKH